MAILKLIYRLNMTPMNTFPISGGFEGGRNLLDPKIL